MNVLKSLLIVVFTLTISNSSFAQGNYQSPWTVGAGYNFVDDDGAMFGKIFSFRNAWSSNYYPNLISGERVIANGFSAELIASFNKYKVGKTIDNNVITDQRFFMAFDANLKFDLNTVMGQTSIVDPYVLMGFGYTLRGGVGNVTNNWGFGANFWLVNNVGLYLQTSGKFAIQKASKGATAYLQHAVGVKYKFGKKQFVPGAIYNPSLDNMPKTSGRR